MTAPVSEPCPFGRHVLREQLPSRAACERRLIDGRHANIGGLLYSLGDLDGALAAYRAVERFATEGPFDFTQGDLLISRDPINLGSVQR